MGLATRAFATALGVFMIYLFQDRRVAVRGLFRPALTGRRVRAQFYHQSIARNKRLLARMGVASAKVILRNSDRDRFSSGGLLIGRPRQRGHQGKDKVSKIRFYT